MEQKQHKYLIFLCLFIYSFFETVPGFSIRTNYVSWFCVIYFISSYIRLYSFPHKGDVKYWLIASFVSIVISCFSILVIIVFNRPFYYYFVSDSYAILAIIVAFCTFNFFNSINIAYNKWINMIGGSTFGVLLIHANSNMMRQWLWKDTIQCAEHFNTPYYPLYAILCVLIIFSICILIDRIRILTIEKWTLNLINRYIPR